MRAMVTFTVAESKKLLAKATVKHPVVVKALADHTVIWAAGPQMHLFIRRSPGKR